MTTEQIAANLNLSVKTVQNYHYLIKTKTGMRTDAQLVRLAVECGRPACSRGCRPLGAIGWRRVEQ